MSPSNRTNETARGTKKKMKEKTNCRNNLRIIHEICPIIHKQKFECGMPRQMEFNRLIKSRKMLRERLREGGWGGDGAARVRGEKKKRRWKKTGKMLWFSPACQWRCANEKPGVVFGTRQSSRVPQMTVKQKTIIASCVPRIGRRQRLRYHPHLHAATHRCRSVSRRILLISLPHLAARFFLYEFA